MVSYRLVTINPSMSIDVCTNSTANGPVAFRLGCMWHQDYEERLQNITVAPILLSALILCVRGIQVQGSGGAFLEGLAMKGLVLFLFIVSMSVCLPRPIRPRSLTTTNARRRLCRPSLLPSVALCIRVTSSSYMSTAAMPLPRTIWTRFTIWPLSKSVCCLHTNGSFSINPY